MGMISPFPLQINVPVWASTNPTAITQANAVTQCKSPNARAQRLQSAPFCSKGGQTNLSQSAKT
jgi:predicted membrane-bound dolichyl-phosphate-mannose-protein mannosyltransferase